MHNNAPTLCRCCNGQPVVGYFGLCRTCSKAVDRFITLRRANLQTKGTK